MSEYYAGDDKAYVVWHGITHAGEHTKEGTYYHGDTEELWPATLNGTQVQKADGTGEYGTDEERLAYVSERWTFPEMLVLQEATADARR